MGTKDPRVDAYIAKQAAFAQPILAELRAIAHEADPGITEDIKWGAPAFMHKGIVFIMAGFKAHVGVNFWKSALIVPSQSRRATDDKAMAQIGRMASLAEMPPRRTVIGYIKAAIKLNAGSVGVSKRREEAAVKKPAPLRTPPSLSAALKRNAKARTTFDNFSASHKREYIEWISEAKTAETRDRRIEQALGWMAAGKARHWRYMKKR